MCELGRAAVTWSPPKQVEGATSGIPGVVDVMLEARMALQIEVILVGMALRDTGI